MNAPIETTGATDQTLYAIIRRPDGLVWNEQDQGWQAYGDGQWANYAVPLAEQGSSGYYRADFPDAASGYLTTEVVYIQGGGAPAVGDAPAGIGQSQGTSVAAVGNDVVAAMNMLANLRGMTTGKAVAGTLSRTQVTTDLATGTDNALKGRLILWTSGACLFQSSYIQASETGTQLLTFGALTEAPGVDDTFVII